MANRGTFPYVSTFQGESNIQAADFVKIFQKYDVDGNGYIEASELDSFLGDLAKECMNLNESTSKQSMAEFKKSVLGSYDENHDGRISSAELAKILPTKENFLLHFRESTNLHVADFMKIWYHYDVDRSGYLERNELKSFLVDLLTRHAQQNEDNKDENLKKLDEYTEVMLELFDFNKDNRIELSELAKILPVEENYLARFKSDAELTKDEFDDLFRHYDQDNNGQIEDTELMGFIRDVLARTGKEPTMNTLEQYRQNILNICDTNKDGKLSSKELALMLCKERN